MASVSRPLNTSAGEDRCFFSVAIGTPCCKPKGVQRTTRHSVLRHSAGERDKAWRWQPVAAGHVHNAQKYARRVLTKAALSIDSWRLMYCALRGH
jgi:hypothetical protein